MFKKMQNLIKAALKWTVYLRIFLGLVIIAGSVYYIVFNKTTVRLTARQLALMSLSAWLIWLLIFDRFFHAFCDFVVSLVGFRNHAKWQLQRKNPCVKVDEKLYFSRYLRVGKGVLVAPRKGYDVDQIEADRRSAGDEFSLPLCATVAFDGWLNRFGFRYIYVADQTLKPLKRPKQKPLKDTANPLIIGIREDGDPLSIDMWAGSFILIAGTSGGGKSRIMRNIFEPLLGSDVQVNLIDLTRQFVSYSGSISNVFEVEKLIIGLAEETARRQELLAAHHASDIRELPQNLRPQRILTVIDEASLLLWKDLASTKKDATDTEKSIAKIQVSLSQLLSFSRKCGIVFLASLTDPIQSEFGLRLTQATIRIAVDCGTNGVSEAFLGEKIGNDNSLVNGRCYIRTQGYRGFARVFEIADRRSKK